MSSTETKAAELISSDPLASLRALIDVGYGIRSF